MTAAALATGTAERVAGLDWRRIAEDLDVRGFATTGPVLSRAECSALADGYGRDELFRKRVVMERHGFGRGEYKYFAYPLPTMVAALRAAFYPPLVAVANRWSGLLKLDTRYPERLDDMLQRCHAAGQTRPTPLLLKYESQDYNCLHQDLYGDQVFPLQLAMLLSRPGEDFDGGEFVLVEQRPRMQSRPWVVHLTQGEGVIFATHQRPAQGVRGAYRVNLRHGVSALSGGRRFTLGIIFHDAA